MQHLRAIVRPVASLMALALTGFLLVAVGSAPAQAAEQESRIVIQLGHKKQQFGKTTSVQAQAQVRDAEGNWTVAPFISGSTFQLQRTFPGTAGWTTLESREGSTQAFWTTPARRIATYRVVWSGGTTSGGVTYGQTTSPTRRLNVVRNLNDEINSSTLVLKGKVAPKYKNKRIVVERRACEKGCKWTKFRVIKTNSKNRWSIKLPAPARRGDNLYWRAFVPAQKNLFAKSFTNFSYRTTTF